jgi:hypothetical protein
MHPKTIALLTALVAVFLWINSARAEHALPPLVFNKFAPEIAAEFGEKTPEKVMIVVVTKAPGNLAYVIVIMEQGRGFKWVTGPYASAIKRIRAVVEKNLKLKPASRKIEL